MRLATALIALLLLSSTAQAGGVGLYTQGGAYNERLYFHRADPNAESGVGPIEQDSQLLPMAGAGIEILLGDRDSRIVGISRIYWQMEGPQSTPDLPGQIIAQPREDLRHVGVFSVGLQAGLVGNPDKAMLTAVGLIGSGFLTIDHTEYVFGDFGVGGTYRLGRSLELYGNLMGHVRFRKWARGGAVGAAGIRVLFD